MAFEPGTKFGSYEICEMIGRGGMATIYKCYHAALDRHVALKIILQSFLSEVDFMTRFQREARVAASLDHPNIVPVYDFAEQNGHPYLVMKWIEGLTLKQLLKEQTLSQEQMLTVVESVGKALSYAHQKRILHRDIKPSNIMITEDWKVYLMDFGLARLVQTGDSSLTGSQIIGTPHYMSPEQAVSSTNLTSQTDIYSFGVMIYEMVTGKVPFHSDTPLSIIHDHIYTPVPAPRTIKENIPDKLENVILKALEKKPEDRYGSVEELVADFRKALAEMPVEENQHSHLPDSGQTQAVKELSPDRIATLPSIEGKSDNFVEDIPDEKADNEKLDSKHEKPKSKPKRSFWQYLFLGILAVIIIFCVFAGISRLGEWVKNRSENQVEQTAEIAVDNGAVEELLQGALDHLDADNYERAEAALRELRNLMGDDPADYENVLLELVRQKEWLLAAMLMIHPNSSLTAEMGALQSRQMHSVIYLAASDVRSGVFFEKNHNHPLVLIGELRYKLQFGEKEAAHQTLERILQNEKQLQEFPEALLLQAEWLLSINEKDDAEQILKDIVENKDNFPEWMVNSARSMLNQINTL